MTPRARHPALALAVTLALASPACGDSASSPAGDGADTAAEAETVTPRTLAYRPDATSGEAVTLSLVSLDADTLVVDVVTRGFRADDQIMAVGLRLTYDPAVLSFASATPAPPWQDAVTMASGATPGVVVAGVAHPHPFYEEPQAPSGDVSLFRLTFGVVAPGPTPLALVASRSRAAVWPSGADPERVLQVGWVGGALVLE
jgi:hypothetical protein